MMNRSAWLLTTLLGLLLPAAGLAAECAPDSGVALQVLGSGGPVADDGRASSAYLVWVDGKARVLVDAGGGSFLRFGESGARFEDLSLVALSHYHTDHSADFPALLKSGYFSDRSEPLPVSGPTGDDPFPSLAVYLDALLQPGSGAYGYLGGYLDGSGGLIPLQPVEVDHASGEVHSILESDLLSVTAMGVPHGIVPSVAYRVDVRGQSLVFASDQNGTDARFIDFARDADWLVAHVAIPEHASGVAVRLHARPSRWAEMAAESESRNLLLSHWMARSLATRATITSLVAEIFPGNVAVAEDGSCYVLNSR